MVLWTTVAAVKLVQCGAGLDVFCGQSEGICLLTCARWAEETVTLTSDSKNFSPATGRIYIYFYFEIKKTLEKKKQDIEGGKWEFGFGDFRVSFRHLTGDLNKPLDL